MPTSSCNRNFSPKWLRHLLQPLQGLPKPPGLARVRPAALGNRASEAHINGVERVIFLTALAS